MTLGRFIRQHKSQALLAILLIGSLGSLITGTESSFIHRGLSRFVHLTSYPLLKLQQTVKEAFAGAYGYFADYQDALKKNEAYALELASANKKLTRMRELENENLRLRRLLKFSRDEVRLGLLPVKVLESYKGLLRIDGGISKGIQVSMGAITANGVVGIVTEVADFTATVATLHHPDCRIGAMVLRNRLRAYDGIVHPSGDFSHLCTMEYIDLKEEVRVGDWVVTSPESQFPAGLTIGQIRAVRKGSGIWKSAEIDPAVDPYRLDEVLILTSSVEDADYLAGPPVTLSADKQSGDLPASSPVLSRDPIADIPSVQERFSP